ncbi:MAG TPA: hypothetical protein VES93_15090 [Ornithinibacter sp.]|nr:hypothetical protein [Ornithinibacter sp.]
MSRADVRTEVAAGRWTAAGTHSALQAAGLTGFTSPTIQVSVPMACRRRSCPGVRATRRRTIGPVAGAGIPRVKPEFAAVRAADDAASDRAAVLVLRLVLQQRLTRPDRLEAAWQRVQRSGRRALLDTVIPDICDGAHSLGELDFARMCRRAGLPPPTRQVVRTGPGGRVYLDVAWEDIGLVVEIDGGHHGLALNPVDDALRQNEVTLGADMVLRIPVLGLG